MAEAVTSRTAPSPDAPPAGARLARVLGARDAAAIMISNMVGVGILTLPGIVALSLGSVPLALVAWALGGAVSLAGALVHAELGCRYPLAGGDYVYLNKAFGSLPAFLSGWTSFVIGFPGAIAASSMAAAAALFDAAGLPEARAGQLLLALALLLGLTAIHSLGLRWGKRVQNALVAVKLSVLVLLVAGAWLVAGSSTPPGSPPGAAAEAAASMTPGADSPPAAVAALIILFAYSGWNAAAYVAGEIRAPRRDIPLALVGGGVVVTVLYLAMNLAYFRVIPPEEMGKNINVGGEVARKVLGEGGAQALSLALSLLFLGGASAMIITGPRIYYAMARDGLFPRAIAAVGASSRAPSRAIWLQTLWAAAILIAGAAMTPASRGIADTFERIVSWTTFAILPFAALTTSCVFIFRRRDRARNWTPSFPAPGYPWTPIAFVAACIAVEAAFIAVSAENRWNALVGSALVLSGVPAYLFWRPRAKAGAGVGAGGGDG